LTLSIIQGAALRSFNALGLARGARVLDAPCGDGSLAAALSRSGYDAHGVDIDASAARVLGAGYQRADLNGPLPFADA
jgi:2-polyprenyl-3-methyl-5-hydroxy-6-metoxy-1,4-benzoquinol methylase